MLLASPTDVLSRLGLATSEDRLVSVKSALQGVTFKIESDIGTELSNRDRIDYFSVPSYNTQPRIITLRLAQGFVDRDSDIIVSLSTSGSISDSTSVIVIPEDEYEVDFNLGTVTIHGTIYSGSEVYSVQYTSGFGVSGADKIAAGIPDWLEEAAKSATVLILNAENFSRQKTKNFKYDTNLAHRMYTNIVNPHIRPRSSGISPARETLV